MLASGRQPLQAGFVATWMVAPFRQEPWAPLADADAEAKPDTFTGGRKRQTLNGGRALDGLASDRALDGPRAKVGARGSGDLQWPCLATAWARSKLSVTAW